MATLGNTWPTLLDLAQSLDPGGKRAMVAEMMQKVNPIYEDIPFIEANNDTGHEGTIRTGLPSVYWRLLNKGVPPSKSKKEKVLDTCARLEGWGQIDEAEAELNGGAAYRMQEDIAWIQSMGIEMASTIFYGNSATDPEKFLGLAPRFGALSGFDASAQVINAGGTGADTTSIWLIAWGPQTIHGIYPKGTKAGLEVHDHGSETNVDSSGNLMRVLRTQVVQRAGIHLRDWQCMSRIANIETTGGTTIAFASVTLDQYMIQAWYKIPQRLRATGRLAFYCNSMVKEALVKRAMLTLGANTLTVEHLKDGEPMVRFWGIPIRECDAILNTENAVA